MYVPKELWAAMFSSNWLDVVVMSAVNLTPSTSKSYLANRYVHITPLIGQIREVT